MYELYPYYTNDGSIGLYSPENNDIYHSAYGALTEAFEKFVLPSEPEFYLLKNSEIKILDICYGIGYNSKSFLNYFFENFLKSKNAYTVQIDTDNIKSLSYNEKLYTDNTFSKNSKQNSKKIENFNIYIKAIDKDKILSFISPFINFAGKKIPKNNKLPFENEKISKILKKSAINKIKFHKEINMIFLKKIAENHPEIFEENELEFILKSKKYRTFFDDDIKRFFEFLKLERYKNTPLKHFLAFLHNIYYRNISNRHKMAFKSPIYKNFIFDLKINDARNELRSDNYIYDLIFLDAFTPAKCPALWTIDFFKLLYSHLDFDGKILTYTNSATVRNAFLQAGFHIGKIYNPSAKKYMGTIAVKNPALIKNDLSDFDLGLIKTKAGIFYRDENLNASDDEIITTHKNDVENSNLKSGSWYMKQFKSSGVI